MLIAVAWTMLLNLMRVAAVAALAAFHDGGTILVVGWLLTFWAFAQRRILRLESFEDVEEAIA